MKDQDKKSVEETKRAAREQERKKAYMAKEQAMAMAADSRKSGQAGARATEETARLAWEQARKEAYSANEKKTAEAHEARKARANGEQQTRSSK